MNDINWVVVIGIVVVGAAAIFLFGGQEEAPVIPALLLSPTADAGPDKVLGECGSVRVGCDGFDPAGGDVSFRWTATAGSFDNPHSLHPLYTAPSTCGMEDVTLTLIVTSEQNVVAQDSLIVHVRDSVPCATPVTCPATTPCMASVRIASHSVSTPRVLEQPVRVPAPVACRPMPPACVPAPVVCPPVTPICVPVPDIRPCQNPCSVPCSACAKPSASSCSAACPSEFVVEGGSIQLRGTVWDIDRNLTSYYWTADKGRFNDSSAINPVYYAPMTCNPCGENIRIALNVVDSCGATSSSQIVLHVSNLD